jgi:3-hydroxyacyl-CoA dehydrogenase
MYYLQDKCVVDEKEHAMAAGKTTVAIIGAGFIGRAWAVAFARAGMNVKIWSRSEATAQKAIAFLAQVLPSLGEEGLLGDFSSQEILSNARIETRLEVALEGADYIQENAPEDLQSKRDVFSLLDSLAEKNAIIASSTSALLPSDFTDHLQGRARCLVAHPVNPPYLIPATEVVPAPWTSPDIVDRVCAILRAAGQKPLIMEKELDGFIVNRLQGAVLNEAFRLVGEGYATIEDVDTAIKDGLALRWSFMGPFETLDLNAPLGVRDYIEKYNGLYQNLHTQMAERTNWEGPVMETVARGRRAVLPTEALGKRQLWRDRRLMALIRHKLDADARIGS